jgi:hypothetical protein
VRESRPPGSVRGVRRNVHPYRDRNRSSLSVPYFRLGPRFNERIVLLATVENDQKEAYGLRQDFARCYLTRARTPSRIQSTAKSKARGGFLENAPESRAFSRAG